MSGVTEDICDGRTRWRVMRMEQRELHQRAAKAGLRLIKRFWSNGLHARGVHTIQVVFFETTWVKSEHQNVGLIPVEAYEVIRAWEDAKKGAGIAPRDFGKLSETTILGLAADAALAVGKGKSFL